MVFGTVFVQPSLFQSKTFKSKTIFKKKGKVPGLLRLGEAVGVLKQDSAQARCCEHSEGPASVD